MSHVVDKVFIYLNEALLKRQCGAHANQPPNTARATITNRQVHAEVLNKKDGLFAFGVPRMKRAAEATQTTSNPPQFAGFLLRKVTRRHVPCASFKLPMLVLHDMSLHSAINPAGE